jgi:hypothetical protein
MVCGWRAAAFQALAKRLRETSRAAREQLAAPVRDTGSDLVARAANLSVQRATAQWRKARVLVLALPLASHSAQETLLRWARAARSHSEEEMQ